MYGDSRATCAQGRFRGSGSMKDAAMSQPALIEELSSEELSLENAALKAKMRELEQDQKILRTLTGIIPDGFLVVARNGSIRDINPAYCAYFGTTSDKVIGMPILDLIANTKMIEIMDKNLTEIDAIHEFIKGQTATGERKVAVTRLPVTDEDGEIFASVALVKFSSYTNKLVQSLQELGEEIEYYRKELSRHFISQFSFDSLYTASPIFRESKRLAERFAKSDLPILLRGETGAGKEVFANAIHNASSRRNGPFICINCASIPAELLESELFGYADGAFTGGKRGGKRGKFELANNGTLLLDEIGDMPLFLQAKLLRVLQSNIVDKVGGETPILLNVRILATTNRNLEQKIEDNSFREDLYYRLNVLSVTVPPLRDHKEDIPALVYEFLGELNQKYSRNLSISQETLTCLQKYSWSGNIRELKNVVGRAFMTTEENFIEPENLPPYLFMALGKSQDDEGGGELFLKHEREAILAALRKQHFNCARVAKSLGLHRATLYAKMKRYGIKIKELRDTALR